MSFMQVLVVLPSIRPHRDTDIRRLGSLSQHDTNHCVYNNKRLVANAKFLRALEFLIWAAGLGTAIGFFYSSSDLIYLTASFQDAVFILFKTCTLTLEIWSVNVVFLFFFESNVMKRHLTSLHRVDETNMALSDFIAKSVIVRVPGNKCTVQHSILSPCGQCDRLLVVETSFYFATYLLALMVVSLCSLGYIVYAFLEVTRIDASWRGDNVIGFIVSIAIILMYGFILLSQSLSRRSSDKVRPQNSKSEVALQSIDMLQAAVRPKERRDELGTSRELLNVNATPKVHSPNLIPLKSLAGSHFGSQASVNYLAVPSQVDHAKTRAGSIKTEPVLLTPAADSMVIPQPYFGAIFGGVSQLASPVPADSNAESTAVNKSTQDPATFVNGTTTDISSAVIQSAVAHDMTNVDISGAAKPWHPLQPTPHDYKFTPPSNQVFAPTFVDEAQIQPPSAVNLRQPTHPAIAAANRFSRVPKLPAPETSILTPATVMQIIRWLESSEGLNSKQSLLSLSSKGQTMASMTTPYLLDALQSVFQTYGTAIFTHANRLLFLRLGRLEGTDMEGVPDAFDPLSFQFYIKPTATRNFKGDFASIVDPEGKIDMQWSEKFESVEDVKKALICLWKLAEFLRIENIYAQP